jgi:intracellular sulfur oxidation DsrE/DsrF family protein
MNHLIKLALGAVLASTMLFSNAFAADSGYGKQKVVYHINYDNPKAQAGALRNIQNHINAVGAENLDLKVVLHGNGLALLLEPDSLEKLGKFKHANATDDMTAKVSGLKDQGIEFAVCANTINGRKVDYMTDLYDVSDKDIVPSGVAEVAKLQAMGYSYIKP